MKEQAVLSIKNISKFFPGVCALKDFSMDIAKGEIHGIVGENGAGKSTLVNILSGDMQQNKGEIFLRGEPVRFSNPRDAHILGISAVHQELVNCPHISVAENIFMNSIDSNNRAVMNYKRMYKEAGKLLGSFNVKIDPRDKIKKLNISEQQIVEIIKAISINCGIIIFDEPTSALTENETEQLFKIIKDLKQQNISIIYISHRMEEIFKLCDRVTVLKDGMFVETMDVSTVSKNTVLSKMVGREIEDIYPEKADKLKDVILKAEKLNLHGVFKNIDFELREGEVLGFSGIMGSGRSEIIRSLCGLYPLHSGEVYLKGKKIKISKYADAIKKGIVYLTDDRKGEGLMLNMDIKMNISALDIDNVSNKVFIKPKKETDQAARLCDELNVKKSSINQKVRTLSGGNQQKILIAKLLSIKPKIIIMDEPTRGIDVNAKAEIHRMLRQLASDGIGIILISSELPEIIGMCDRVIVIHEGKINGELSGKDISEITIMHKASGY